MNRLNRTAATLLGLFGPLLSAGAAWAQQATSEPAPSSLERVEVTGSAIRRADAETALPVTVITRQQLESSGANTVAEVMRNATFASAGNFRPQSGSSAQSFAEINLRGLGSQRTLVLLDGRRLPQAPMLGESVDMNTIPLAAVERIEILSDGASAIYGSDAIGGVVNVITRKNFEGLAFTWGTSKPENEGGDRNELSAVFGLSGDKGRLVGGFGRTERQMVYTRQRPWGSAQGVSNYGNNYRVINADGTLGPVTAVPGGCTDTNFWTTAAGTCSYDFNKVAADEAALTNSSLFLRGEMNLNADWSVFLNTSVSRVESFGRYAPVPGLVEVAAGSPNNPTGGASDILLYHRFAAAGNRDNNTENNLYDVMAGVQGRIGSIDIEAGVRNTESKYLELGRNYIVRPLAEQYINSGEYDIFLPSQNPAEILNSIKATISRDAFFKQQEAYGRATFDLFSLAGGMSRLSLGAEFRTEDYADQYDSLQEAGVIEGASGNSAAGSREVLSGMVELLLPVTKTVEVSLAGRYERYSDYGNDFAPKASVRWQPMRGFVLRGSVGQGFRAPSLPILNAQPQFSAESVVDPRTCTAFGGSDCNRTQVQVDTYFIANPTLKSEQSDQYSLGFVWDVTRNVNVKADYWNTKIDDTITQIGAQDIIDRSNGDDPRSIPSGLGITRAADGSIVEIRAGYANEGTLKASGLDIGAGVNYQVAGVGNFRHDLLVSWMMKYEVDGSDLIAEKDQGLPEYRASLQNAWRLGQFNAAWNVNYIGKNGTGRFATKEYTTHDVAFDWAPTFSKGTKLTVGVVNLFDKMPELVPYEGRNFNFYLYDSYGRTPYVRVSHKF